MKFRHSSPPVQAGIILIALAGGLATACSHGKSAADTIKPVKAYFESMTGKNVVSPDLNSIEGARGMILTWRVGDRDSAQITEYSWVLAKNTDQLKKTLIVFDSARAWNTEAYIFLPVSTPAVEVHQKVGLSVPKAIYDEDGMNRIREIVLTGKMPKGGVVDQFSQFMDR
jgi:hypothetical protein